MDTPVIMGDIPSCMYARRLPEEIADDLRYQQLRSNNKMPQLVRHHDEDQLDYELQAGSQRGGSDPLLAALIGKLPAVGAEFTAAARRKWLDMMAMAFDVAYGPIETGHLQAAPWRLTSTASSAPPAASRPAHAGHDFYIALDGTACQTDGRPPVMGDVPPGEMIFDYRPVTGEFRDTASITWADGARGIGGLAGVSFCGPG